jgi:plasmid replication initiation protein
MGIKSTEYPEFKKLNTRVISVPVKKISESEVSDILVFPEFFKEGRKITGIYFRVESKKQTRLPFSVFEEEGAFRFAKVPINRDAQAQYLAIRSEAEIELCIERANEYAKNKEKKSGTELNYG